MHERFSREEKVRNLLGATLVTVGSLAMVAFSWPPTSIVELLTAASVVVFGLLGYVMRVLGFSAAPLLLGFVLGPLMEEHFRRAMLISAGDFGFFFERPISAVVMSLTALLLAHSLYRTVRTRMKPKIDAAE